MLPHPNVTFGGGAQEATITPLGLFLLLVAVVLVLLLPRKHAIVPFLLFVTLVPFGQSFYLDGVHLFADRILILVACLRFLAQPLYSQEVFAGGFNNIDKVFLTWALSRATAFILLYHVGGAVVNQVGFLWDVLGGYFLIRCLIRNVNDIHLVAKVLVLIAGIIACCMLYEHFKLTNIFAALMGGQIVPDFRGGKYRCRGPFEQEILASVFGGTLLPLFVWLWTAAKSEVAAKAIALLGLLSSAIITITAASSTGIAAAVVGIGALCLWPLRKHVRFVLWGLVVMIFALAIAMKAPIWFILARVDFVGGSTGWDRANLIDQCVRHFSSWWLVGTADNANWGFFTWDLCNQFVAEAEQGGLLTLILFIVLVTRSFKKIGFARKKVRTQTHEWLLWTTGCILCAHVAGFIGVSYFDQSKFWWFVTLAMIPAAAKVVRTPGGDQPKAARVAQVRAFRSDEIKGTSAATVGARSVIHDPVP
jgi:hypothetical protein